jgi:hypothetical protein
VSGEANTSSTPDVMQLKDPYRGKKKPHPQTTARVGARKSQTKSLRDGKLETVPEELVVDLVVVLDFRGFDEGAQSPGAAISGGLFEIGVACLDVGTEKLGGPISLLKILQSGINIVRKIALGLAKVLDFGSVAVEASLENGV